VLDLGLKTRNREETSLARTESLFGIVCDSVELRSKSRSHLKQVKRVFREQLTRSHY